MSVELSIPLLLEERSGLQRVHEPVTVGIPFPRGVVVDHARLALFDHQALQLPVQVQELARWHDGSIQWALLDFHACAEPKETAEYRLEYPHPPMREHQHPTLSVQHTSDSLVIDTGKGIFTLNANTFKPFERITLQGVEGAGPMGSSMVLTDDAGTEYEPRITSTTLEAQGPVKLTVRIDGQFTDHRSSIAHFVARLSFYAHSGLVVLKFTLHNPQAARHPGGCWDLGDEGSMYFKDLSLHTYLQSHRAVVATWTMDPSQPLVPGDRSTIEIYQDSSGGRNWKSANHVNRFGHVMQSFPGYRVTADGVVIQEGKRAAPVIAIQDHTHCIAGAIEGFWQNFPKAVEAQQNRLSLRLFPHQYGDVYELQGGEQKTHTLFLEFDQLRNAGASISWVHDRLIPRTTPEWYAQSQAVTYLVPRDQKTHEAYVSLVDTAIKGDHTFFDRREIIDEYGWRHFGEVYADHEAIGHTGHAPLVSHYNNQYDVIYGTLLQYLSSGDLRWFHLMNDLAKHVIDIDIYHTQDDCPDYNGGLFWHTDHYIDVATATHRTYSKANRGTKSQHQHGGGPSSGHNYTTGLLHYYFLTGDPAGREAVQGLAEWVINMDDGSQRRFGFFDKRPTGKASATVSHDCHGPGRGSGNSINALLDAYLLTRDEKYFAKTEELIRRCIHPYDDIQKHNLSDIEYRWSYTMFLQALGKYLDVKAESNQNDYMYSYARASLLHYTQWMLANEVPYKGVLDQVEIPTETWPAQDIRKSHVFNVAAKHADAPLRSALRQKADFFFHACLTDLRSFETWGLTRPIVLLMTNGSMHAYCQLHPDDTAPRPGQAYDFGVPQEFTAQFSALYATKERCVSLVQALRHLKHGLFRNSQQRGVEIDG